MERTGNQGDGREGKREAQNGSHRKLHAKLDTISPPHHAQKYCEQADGTHLLQARANCITMGVKSVESLALRRTAAPPRCDINGA